VDELTSEHVRGLSFFLSAVHVCSLGGQYANLLKESGLEPIVESIESRTDEVSLFQ
jgi:hypothetical protein